MALRAETSRRPKPHHCVKSAMDWPDLGDEHIVTLLQYQASPGKSVDPSGNRCDLRMRQITPSSPIWPSRRDPGPP